MFRMPWAGLSMSLAWMSMATRSFRTIPLLVENVSREGKGGGVREEE